MGRKSVMAGLVCVLATSVLFASGRVVVMPDQQIRPLQSMQLFGAATNNGPGNLGDGSAVGEAYVWSFTPNPNVIVTGNLAGLVANDRFIAESVSFSLVGSTRESITWTLKVGGNPSSNTVTIDIVDPTDPISDTPLEDLSVDVNISLKEGLKYIYQQQQVNGSWVEPNYAGYGDGAVTGFCTWAFENDGHVPTDDPNQDVYAEFVGKALGYLQGTATVQGTFAANANVPREGGPQTSDLNSNGKSQKLASFDTWSGYSHPIAMAAFLASLDTASYQELVEDAIDYIGFMQSPSGYCSGDFNPCMQNSDCPGSYCSYRGNPCTVTSDCVQNFCNFSVNPCTLDSDCPLLGDGEVCITQTCGAQICDGSGGWDYNGPSNRSDYSINSWNWMAVEGAESTSYAVDAPDWILQESERTLITHQTNPPDQPVGQPYGYSSGTPLLGHPNQGHATTCAGLSGLAAVQFEDAVPVGSLISAEPAPLASIAARRAAALAWLGEKWNVDTTNAPFNLGSGNRGNPYAHWTCCRGLRLTEASLGIPADSLTLVNGGVSFNWATGEENGSGNVAAPGSPREGYLPWIVRHQLPNGQWNFPAYTGTVLESCLDMLCLNPVVFGSCGDGTVVPPEQCDDGNTVDGDGCSANCTFETPPCDDASVTPPECDGLCPPPDECTFAPSLQRCACRPTLVTLEYFTAQAEAGGVRLRWKTTAETDNIGFRILLERPKEGAVAISPLIATQGSDLVGAEYQYFDTSAKRRGKTYTYYLQDLDNEGVSTVRGEPVEVVIQGRLRPAVAEAPRSSSR